MAYNIQADFYSDFGIFWIFPLKNDFSIEKNFFLCYNDYQRKNRYRKEVHHEDRI